eukprot:scaffold175450_cov34-Attheya_sp.AAC.1
MMPGIEPGTTGASPEVNTNYTTVSMALTYLFRSLILSVVSMSCSISLQDALSSLLYPVYLDCMLLALSHHPSPRVSFVI